MQYLATALPVSIARAKEVIENFMMDDRLFLGDTESRELGCEWPKAKVESWDD